MKIMLIVFIITIAYIVGMSKFEQYMSIDNMRYNISNIDYSTDSRLDVIDEDSNQIEVTLSGHVVTPKTIKMDMGSTLRDAIATCGGLKLTADLRSITLDLIISEDIAIYIPGLNVGTNKVSINQGDEEELMSLPKIGSVYANAIIEYRTINGDFTYLEQLMEVPGIGSGTFNAIKDYIVLV